MALSFSVRSKRSTSVETEQPLGVVATPRRLKTPERTWQRESSPVGRETGEPGLWLVPVGEETVVFLLATPVHDPSCWSGARATAKVSASKFQVGHKCEGLCAVSLGGNEGFNGFNGFIRDDWGDVSCYFGCFVWRYRYFQPAGEPNDIVSAIFTADRHWAL